MEYALEEKRLPDEAVLPGAIAVSFCMESSDGFCVAVKTICRM
jgi:hypothetical protein